MNGPARQRPVARVQRRGSVAGGDDGGAGSDGGSITTFVVLMVVPCVLMTALAFDGGQILAARRQAGDLAQNAALAGAQSIAESTVRQGSVDVDAARVEQAALDHLARHGGSGTVEVLPNEVVVTVEGTADLVLLPLVGITSRPVSGVGRAELQRGVDAADVVGRP